MDKLYLVLLVLWFFWMFVGSVFYAYDNDLGWAKGFYMAVNVGYSIGWGDISEIGRPRSQWFSIFYVLCGSSFVAAALGIFANSIVSDKSNWYENELKKIAYDEVMESSARPVIKARCWINYHWEKLRSVLLWLCFVFFAVIGALETNGEWYFVNALYFAISSLSTGGLFAQTPGRPDWVYGMTGLYAALGVPIMALAMATMASFVIDPGSSIEDTLKKVKEPVTEKEINMLTTFKIADEDGELDKAEFVILCMVRIGAASPECIKLIMDYFIELDEDGSGSLSVDEICKRKLDAPKAHADVKKQAKRYSVGLMAPVIDHLTEPVVLNLAPGSHQGGSDTVEMSNVVLSPMNKA